MTEEQDRAAERLRSGQAWEEFCDRLKAAGKIVVERSPDTDLDRAEGFRYLTRLLRMGLKFSLEYADPAAPQLIQYMHETQKFGVDNPDQIYLWARIAGQYEYRLSGPRGNVNYLGISVYAGSMGRGGRRRIAHLNADDLSVGPDGRFELILSAREQPGNWIQLAPDTTTLLVRQTLNSGPLELPVPLRGRPGLSWPMGTPDSSDAQSPVPLTLERLDCTEPPPPLAPSRVVKGLERALLQVTGSATAFADLSDRMAQQPNVLHDTDLKLWGETFGDPDIRPMGGYWKLAPDEALVIEFTPPECRTWSFLLCNYWAESLEYRYRPVWTNKRRANTRPDGAVKIVVAHEDPRLPGVTWIDTEGHREGFMTLRWVLAHDPPLPQARVVTRAGLTDDT